MSIDITFLGSCAKQRCAEWKSNQSPCRWAKNTNIINLLMKQQGRLTKTQFLIIDEIILFFKQIDNSLSWRPLSTQSMLLVDSLCIKDFFCSAPPPLCFTSLARTKWDPCLFWQFIDIISRAIYCRDPDAYSLLLTINYHVGQIEKDFSFFLSILIKIIRRR